MNNEIQNFVATCSVCEKYRVSNVKEPLIGQDTPILPFKQIGMDVLWR